MTDFDGLLGKVIPPPPFVQRAAFQGGDGGYNGRLAPETKAAYAACAKYWAYGATDRDLCQQRSR